MTRPPIRGDHDWGDDEEDEFDYDDEYDDVDDRPGVYHPRADEYEYEEVRRPATRRTRLLVVLACVAGLLLVAFGGAAWWVHRQLDPPGAPGDPVAFEIPTGSSNADIAELLQQKGVVSSSFAFENYLRVKGQSGFQAGNYVIPARSSAWDVVAALRAGPGQAAFATFTVPEGLMISQVAGAITDPAHGIPGLDAQRINDLIAGGTIRPTSMPADVTNLEGYLFPDTYQLEEGQDEQAALQRMTQRFDEVATDLRLAERASALGLSPYEVVVVASLVQAEYGIPDDAPKIARTIYNRLDQGIPLGIDATSRYEAVLDGRDRNDVDFTSESPYNTRRNAGLPPTPIDSPGRLALEAALNPADGDFLYYVRVPAGYEGVAEGGHFFTASNSEFLAAKRACEDAGLGCG